MSDDTFVIKTQKRTMPLIPLRGIAVFPYMIVHFDVGRDKSIKALEEAMVNDSMIFLTTQKKAATDVPTAGDFYEVGTVCKIKQMLKLPGETIRVLVEGINRGKIREVLKEEPHFEVEVEELIYEVKSKEDKNLQAMMRLVINNFKEYAKLESNITTNVIDSISEIEEAGRFADVISSYLFLKLENKQKILEAFNPYSRLELINVLLEEELDVLKIEEQIAQRVKSQINKVQKEYYLKEQIKAIYKELGEDEDVEQEVEEYLEKIKKSKMPKEVKERAKKEAGRLLKMSPSSSESGVVRNYVQWLIELPWGKQTKDKNDLKKSREILDEDHYGLKDVKERVLEFLAVRKLSKNMKAPIVCLVGPPGVGKTSIAKSISRALGRKFVRMSLGGMRDEAEIRGHRRTYVGSMPGRIISSLKKAQSINPVFLLDEIDKLNSDFKGDPASALLEVLDPQQNNTFTDHFLEVPFDLSKVLFITTANSLSTIPRPLLDRMEVINVTSYTEDEKYEITKRYLIPKQRKEHGLSEENINIADKAIMEVIRRYTRESGVRSLERQIANIMRKSAKFMLENDKESVKITSKNLDKYLGIPKYSYDKADSTPQVGIVNGLAWTQVGGETLNIEVSVMNGKGKVQLTGQLGDVMKESAMTAITYIRTIASEYGIDENFYSEKDIHIHVPEGAIPKDGPSAGITMASAVTSALTGLPVDSKVAMTGEITLRGRVLPIGGVKEKVLAAKRAGIKKVILPYENKKDMEELDANVKRSMKFVFVKEAKEVLQEVLLRENKNED